MVYLSDDPTVPAALLGLAALVFLVLLKVTQQGKYLIYAGVALVALLAWVGIEWAWVTDEERIENAVYGLAKAVERQDADAAASFLTPDCELTAPGDRGDRYSQYVAVFAGSVTKQKLEAALPRFKWDLIRVSRLQAHAGAISGRGTADCVVFAMGMQQEPVHGLATPPSGMAWSFGLVRMPTGDWKIARITPGRMIQ